MTQKKTQLHIRWPRLVAVILAIVLVPAVLFGLAAYGYFRFGSFEHVNATKPHTEPGGLPVVEDPDAANRHTILVMGEHQGLSDTMILVSVDKAKGQVGALWIPRDTRAFIPGKNAQGVPYGFDKINAANAYWTDDMSGHVRAMQAVSDLLGIQVDDFVQVDMKSFENIVDTLGGVDINVPFDMDYDDPWDDGGGFHVHLKKGQQHLNGQQALGFVRWRHNNDETVQYEAGDIGRIGAQQQFAQALLKQLLRGRTLTRLPALVPQLSRGVKTSLDVSGMVELARELQGIDLSTGVRRSSLPGDAAYEHGISYFIADRDKAQQVVDWVLRFKEKPAFLQEGNARAGDVTVTKPKPPAPGTTTGGTTAGTGSTSGTGTSKTGTTTGGTTSKTGTSTGGTSGASGTSGTSSGTAGSGTTSGSGSVSGGSPAPGTGTSDDAHLNP